MLDIIRTEPICEVLRGDEIVRTDVVMHVESTAHIRTTDHIGAAIGINIYEACHGFIRADHEGKVEGAKPIGVHVYRKTLARGYHQIQATIAIDVSKAHATRSIAEELMLRPELRC